MANSFDISVKNEILAIKAVVDANNVILLDVQGTKIPAVKTVVDANKVILVDVHDTDLPAAKTVVDANKVILLDVQGTKITSILTAIGLNKTELDAIRGADFNAIQANINSNETKIDANTNTLQAVHTSVYFTASVSDDLLFSADTERSVLGTTYTKVKEIRIDYPGTYRFTFNTKVDGANFGFALVYLNGGAHGVEKSFNNTEYPNVESDDLVFAEGDLAQLYLKNGGAADNTFAKEFRVKGVLDTVIEPVIID